MRKKCFNEQNWKNERDIETLENLIDETKRNLLKTFTEPDGDVVVEKITKDWGNKTRNKLDLDMQQDYKESASANNADLPQQMITNNGKVVLTKNWQKPRKSEESAETIQQSLDLFLRNYGNSTDNNQANDIKADFKRRKSKRLKRLRKKNEKSY